MRPFLVHALVVPGLLVAPLAVAGPADRDLARSLADAGLELFQAGRVEDAAAKFEAAEAAFHAPTTLLYLARCKAKLGKLLAARALYRRLASEALAPDAPAP